MKAMTALALLKLIINLKRTFKPVSLARRNSISLIVIVEVT